MFLLGKESHEELKQMCAGGVTFVQQFFFIKVMRQVGISLESQASLFLERGDLFGVINVVFFI